ncbi:MFS transporter [Myceligenerans crystallogenes]|uniref:MFS transporter n=1 Tax=Myceligenerans crystallogenes TaxID=316335 RepID=A0ABN2N937_9MICO
MTSSPPSGALGFWRELPVSGRWLLSTVVLQFFGRGLTLPFTIIYLHEVRGFSLDLAGTLMGVLAAVGLAVTAPAGTLIDRLGARVVILGGLACAVVGYTVLAFATEPWTAALGLALAGVFMGVSWPANNSLVATIVTGDLRQRYFGVNFALLNLGIGVGGVVGGLAMDVDRPVTFVAAFLVNAASFVIPAVVLFGPLRGLSGRAVREVRTMPDDDAAGGTATSPAGSAAGQGETAPAAGGSPASSGAAATRPGTESYPAILRRPEVLWLTVLTLLASFAGYGQMEGGFPAYARGVAGVSTQVIGFAFVVNTVVIVALQFWVMNRTRGRRRTFVLALMAIVWAAAWVLLGLTGLMPGGVAAAATVLLFHAVFALGETLQQTALPALTNDMAPDHLRGRYNAISSGAFQVGAIAAPVAAGFLLDRGLSVAFIALVTLGCLSIAGIALALRRRITAEVDGSPQPALSPHT